MTTVASFDPALTDASLEPTTIGVRSTNDEREARRAPKRHRSRINVGDVGHESAHTAIHARAEAPGLPITVLTTNADFCAQLRAALPEHEVFAATCAAAAVELAASGRCPILISDQTLTATELEALGASLSVHEPGCVKIVVGTTEQTSTLISLQSSGAADGMLLKPVTAGASHLVIESATRQYQSANAKRTRPPAPAPEALLERTQIRSPDETLIRKPARTLPPLSHREAHAETVVARVRPPRHFEFADESMHAVASSTPIRTTHHHGPQPSWAMVIAAIVAAAGIVWWVMQQRMPTIDAQQIITERLAAAQQAYDDGRLIDPEDRSALHHFKTVLALDPHNTTALNGLDRLATQLSDQTRASIDKQRLAEAALSLDRLRRLDPAHRDLPLFSTQLRELQETLLVSNAAPVAIASPVKPEPTPVAVRTRSAQPARTPVAVRTRSAQPAPVPEPNVLPESTLTSIPQRPVETQPEPLTERQSETTTSSTSPSDAAEAPVASTPIAAAPLEQVADSTARTAPVIPAQQTPTAAIVAPGSRGTTVLRTDRALINYVPPTYPAEAATRGMQGWVEVRMRVTPNGDVIEPRIVAGEKRQLFSKAALAAVREWKYEKRPSGDTQAALPMTVRLTFELKD